MSLIGRKQDREQSSEGFIRCCVRPSCAEDTAELASLVTHWAFVLLWSVPSREKKPKTQRSCPLTTW